MRILVVLAIVILGFESPAQLVPVGLVSKASALQAACGACARGGAGEGPTADLMACARPVLAASDCPPNGAGWYWVVRQRPGYVEVVNAHSRHVDNIQAPFYIGGG